MDLHRRYKKKNRARLLKKFAWMSGFLIIAASLAWSFFWLPYFRITNIIADDYISGSELEQTISPYMASVNKFWLPQNNYFLFDPDKISELLKEKEVGIAIADKKFPKTLEISFPETEPWLIYCHTDEKCYYVSPFGILSDTAPRFSENPLPRVITENTAMAIGGSVLSGDEISFLKQFLAEFKTLAITVKEITIKKEIKFLTKEGWYLLADKNAAVQKIFSDLKLLLGQKIKGDRPKLEYIDMRFENKAFYKLR